MPENSPTYSAPELASKPVAVFLRATAAIVRALLLYASLMAWFAVPVLTLRSLVSDPSSLPWIVGAIAALSILALSWTFRDRAAAFFRTVSSMTLTVSERSWLISCLAIGVFVRLAWAFTFPGTPASDGVIYVSLARKLIAGEPYFIGETFSYWPPGYPLYLASWLALIRSQAVAIVASNVAVFVAGALGVWTLARRVGDAAVVRMALAIFVVWPNLAFQAGMPEKEQVLAALLPWIVSAALLVGSAKVPFRQCLLVGLLLGVAILVQPVLLLFPLVLLCYWLICSREPGASLRMLAFTVLGLAVVVAPWTMRNYRVLDHFVLVSTNGGFGLYGANNPKAEGGYLKEWPDDLMRMPEVEADREARLRAVAWIQSNPGRFLELALEKNVRFMGDDAIGVYQSLKRGEGGASAATYAGIKALANLYWLGIWALVLWSLLAGGGGGRPELMLVPFAFLYFLLLHSIVESNGKYHVLTIGILSVLVPMLLASIPSPRSEKIR